MGAFIVKGRDVIGFSWLWLSALGTPNWSAGANPTSKAGNL